MFVNFIYILLVFPKQKDNAFIANGKAMHKGDTKAKNK
jgi:hypothetical protein